MTHEIRRIRCGNCNSSLLSPANPKPGDRAFCPHCGEGDTVENVIAEAREYARLQMAAKIRQGLGKPSEDMQTHRPRFVIDPAEG